MMKKGLMLVGTIGLTAGLMYMFDPDKGKRRRALLRDKARRLVCEAESAIEKTSYDLRERTRSSLTCVSH